MNIYNNMLLLVLSTTAVLLTGCSSDGAFETPASPTEAPPTGIADQNSFTLAVDKTAVEGANLVGIENTVTIYAADRHNHPVPDDTIVRFLTNGGAIEPQCATAGGVCTVKWNSQDPRPDSGYATIIAYTEGEESFLDLNDNDAFDAGEAFDDLSEPYIDEIDPQANQYDIGLEEFVDANFNNAFDSGDNVHTGDSCVGDVTVCNRARLLVWDEIWIGMSTSWAVVTFLPDPLDINVNGITQVIIEVRDGYGNQMAVDTEVKVEATNGEVDGADFTVGNGNVFFVVTYTAPTDPGADILKVTVTSPESKTETLAFLPITVQLP